MPDLGGGVEGRAAGEELPVVEDGLREGLAGGVRAQVSVEAEGLHDGEVGLDGEQGCSGALVLAEDVTSSPGEHSVHATHGTLGHLDLDQEDGLQETRLGEEGRGVQDATGGWDELATTTMDGVGVQGDIHDVESARPHGLLGHGSFS